jgi:hypothetical protein
MIAGVAFCAVVAFVMVQSTLGGTKRAARSAPAE